MSEPWNGPNNSKLASRVPEVFRCPSDLDLGDGETSYFCVVGPGRAQTDHGLRKPGEIQEHPAVLLVESGTSHVNWLEPRDLSIEEVVRGRMGHGAQRDKSLHDGGGDGYRERSPRAF